MKNCKSERVCGITECTTKQITFCFWVLLKQKGREIPENSVSKQDSCFFYAFNGEVHIHTIDTQYKLELQTAR